MVSTFLFDAKDGNRLGKLRHGAITAVANTYNVHHQTIKKIWERAREHFLNPDVCAFRASQKMTHNSGRKKKWNHEEVRDAVRKIPFHQK